MCFDNLIDLIKNELTNEQIQGEKAATDYKDHKVKVVVFGGLVLRLLVDLTTVNGISHDLHPAFEGCNLKKGQICMTHMVKVNLGVDPCVILF